MRRRLHIKTTPFRLSSAVFQYSSLSFPYLTCPTIVCKFFIFAKKISRSADRRCIFFFRIFVCIKGYSSSDSGPKRKISDSRLGFFKFKTMKRHNPNNDGERGNKKLREHAVCESSSSQESSS